MEILCALITAYLVVLFARALMSWFPVRPGTPFSRLFGVLVDLTEPLLAPLRRIIPPAGMFDLSFIVLTVFVLILRTAVCGR